MSTMTSNTATPSTHRPARFHYGNVSYELIDDLVKHMERCESTVLFGPRAIGKQLVIAEVQRRLIQRQAGCTFIRLKMEEQKQVTTCKLLRLLVRQLAIAFQSPPWKPMESFEQLAQVLREQLNEHPIHLVFLVSNLDFLPDSAARQLLKMFRELTQRPGSSPGRVTVLLTGATELASLVHGVNSEFTVTDQFVIEGIAEDVFAQYFNQVAEATCLHFGPGCAELIHRAVGGNILLARVVFDAFLDLRRSSRLPSGVEVTESEIVYVLKSLRSHPTVFRDVVVHPFGELESSLRALSALQRLLSENLVAVKELAALEEHDEEAPTILELCGLARRQGMHLVWASPIVKSFTRGFFTPWTLGDAFASCNCWDKALDSYFAAVSGNQPWIGAQSQRPRLLAASRAFEAMLLTIPSSGDDMIEALRSGLAVGGRYLLGFDDVKFLQYESDPTGTGQRWIPISHSTVGQNERASSDSLWNRHLQRLQASHTGATPVTERNQCNLLVSLPEVKNGSNPVEPADEPFVMVIGLPNDEGNVLECVILENFTTQSPLTRARRSLAESILKGFTTAYQQACRNQRSSREAVHQRQVLKAIPNIFKIIGRENDLVRQALKSAGDELRKIGYHRVMFSLVDHVRRIIKGVVDCRPEFETDIAEKTKFALYRTYEGLYPDVQTACVMEGKTYAINDATTHPLTFKDTVIAADLRSIVVIPLKYRAEVVGTMHVEKLDKSLPTSDEIRWLENWFAEQLTRAINLALRVEMLEDALQEERDAVIVVDHADRIRFLNKAAGRLINRHAGWQQEEPLIAAATFLPPEICQLIQKAKGGKESLSRYLKEPIGHQSMSVVHAGPLKDWRDAIIGTVVQIQDMSGLAGLLKALKGLAACGDADSLGEKLMESLQNLGHHWGRLYLIDQPSRRLVGHAQFGLPPGSPGAIAFQNHIVVLPERTSPASTWVCFDQKRPIVLAHWPGRPIGEQSVTATGLSVINVVDPLCPRYLEKKDGEHWIDVPLYSRDDDRELGKISVDCLTTEFTLAEFEILGILGEAVSAALTAIGSHEERQASEALRQRRMMLEAIGVTCHQLGSKLAALGTLGKRYEIARSPREIDDLNRVWNERLAAIEKTLNETKLRLQPIEAKLQRASLVELIQTVLDEQFTRSQYHLHSEEPVFLCDFDPNRMKEAFEELIANSRKAAHDSPYLNVAITQLMRRDVRMCRIELTDNGPGIPADRLGRVFEPWYSEWSEDQPRSTGLGLSFVQTVIVAHRGVIYAAESPTGQGACFGIEFPRFSN